MIRNDGCTGPGLLLRPVRPKHNSLTLLRKRGIDSRLQPYYNFQTAAYFILMLTCNR